MSQLPPSVRKKPRVLFYSHDALGLGHFRRTLAVAEALTRQVPKAARLLLTAMPADGGFDLPTTFDYVRMPGLDKRRLFEANPDKEPGAPESVLAVRKAIIAATVDSFAPHMMVVDSAPAGLAGELLPILQRDYSNRRRPRFVLGMRDITYGSEQTRQEWERTGSFELLEHVYDLILVYGSPAIFDPIQEYAFPPAVAAKTIFTGYFRRPEALRAAPEIRRQVGATDAPLIVVSAGGGLDGAALVGAFLEAMRSGFLPGVVASVVAGPQMPAPEFARLADLAARLPDVTFVKFRNDLESHVAAADAVVTMGGYNSVWEAVGAGKQPIVIPRHSRLDEQLLRAQRLSAQGLATVILPQDLTPVNLAEAITAELTRSVTPALTLDFDGLDRAGEALARVLTGGSPARTDSRLSHQGAKTAGSPQSGPTEVEVIVCVHDAVADVHRCLASIVAHTAACHGLLIVDDASGPQCRAMLDQFVADHPATSLFRNESRMGYTRSANRGLRASHAELVVLLNSDTIVTSGWLDRLLECARSDKKIGIVGPLSNAAHFQSVPERFANGGWAVNQLPSGWTPDDMAHAIAAIAPHTFPRVGVLNGFCFAIKRAVIETIGYFDEEAFPDGYGEEQDYCFRAIQAGFVLAVADHAYIYHAKTRSYRPDQVAALKQASQAAQLRKHKSKRIRAAIDQTHNEPTLKTMRKAVAALLQETTPLPKL
jgi:predicted glycosyltransferase/GT2 family glycosyltransferase